MNRDLQKYFASYLNLPFEDIQEYFRKQKVIEWVEKELSESKSFLEVGCGQDSIFNYIVNDGLNYIIEPIKEMFETETNRNLSENVVRINSTLENASSNLSQMFDVIIISSLIHEIEDPKYFMERCGKMLNKNGIIVIVTNNKKSIHRILGVELGMLDDLDSRTPTEDEMQQLTGAFTKDEIISFIEETNFRITRIETFIPKILPHRMMEKALDSQVIDLNFIRQLVKLIEFIPEFGSEIILEIKHAK